MRFEGPSGVQELRLILLVGGSVFGLSALALLAMPLWFIQLLGITNSEELRWAFRLMAVTLVALSGNMLIVSSYAAPYGVRMAGILMMFSAAGLGVLTAFIPSSAHNWFTISYSCIGFVFSIAYASQNVRLIGYTGGPNDNKVFPIGNLASVSPPQLHSR